MCKDCVRSALKEAIIAKDKKWNKEDDKPRYPFTQKEVREVLEELIEELPDMGIGPRPKKNYIELVEEKLEAGETVRVDLTNLSILDGLYADIKVTNEENGDIEISIPFVNGTDTLLGVVNTETGRDI